MKVSTTNPVLDRLLGAAGFRKDSELARLLGVSPQAVSKVRKSGKTPTSWINLVSEKFHLPKQDIALNVNLSKVKKNNITSEVAEVDSSELKLLYERCAKLEAKVEKVEQQRDELVQENRQLLRENGDLKARCATLEERQKTCCPESNPLFRKKPGGSEPPNSAQVCA